MRAGDDLGLAVVPADLGLKLGRNRSVALCDDDVGAARQVGHRLAQDAPREQPAVPEGVVAVDEEEVDLAVERQVLQAVVEQDGVDPEAAQGETSTLDTVTVDDDDDAGVGKVARHHVRLIPGLLGSDQDGLAIRDHKGIRAAALGQPTPEAADRRVAPALVAAGKDGDPAPTLRENPGHLHHDWGLTRTPHGEITHDDDLTAKWGVMEKPLAVEPHPKADEKREDPRQNEQECGQQGGKGPVASVIGDIHGEPCYGLRRRGNGTPVLA